MKEKNVTDLFHAWPQMHISQPFAPRKYWLITQEAVAPSRHD